MITRIIAKITVIKSEVTPPSMNSFVTLFEAEAIEEISKRKKNPRVIAIPTLISLHSISKDFA